MNILMNPRTTALILMKAACEVGKESTLRDDHVQSAICLAIAEIINRADDQGAFGEIAQSFGEIPASLSDA